MKTNYKEIADKYKYHHALGGKDPSGGLEQNKNEMLQFCKWMQEHKIKTILEIGLAQGFFSKFLEEIGIDVFGITNNERLLKYRPQMLYVGDSKKYVHSVPVDLVFVDGDHSYEGVKADYENFKGKCKYMAFHDILGLRDCEGVKIFWKEVRGENFVQFIDSGNKGAASGIGVIEISASNRLGFSLTETYKLLNKLADPGKEIEKEAKPKPKRGRKPRKK